MLFERRGHHIFTLWDVDVSVSFWYGVLMAFVVLLWPSLGAMTFADGVLWALAITFSLLVHEYGHAFMAKRYRLSPSIVLHAFGGFCVTGREATSDGDDARMVLAGPLVGLVLAGLIALLYFFAPGIVALSPVTQTLFTALLWVNVVWSLVNLLLPIWPLDGGRLFHLLLRRFAAESKARNWALKASIFAVVPVGIIGLVQFQSLLIALFAGFVLFDNLQALKSQRPLVHRKSGRSRSKPSSFQQELLEDAEEAMENEDWREAARLAHQMRSLGSMPDNTLDEVWTILGLATMNLGDYEEALGYLKRAPEKSKVKKAIRRCEEEVNQSE